MSFAPPEQAKKTIELVPVGTHQAICIKLIDLGTQKTQFDGKEKFSHKIKIVWELPFERRVFKEGEGEMPFTISKKYSYSYFKSSALKQHLMSWLNISEEALQSFDLSEILGKPCLLCVAHLKAHSGDMYTAVTSIAPIMKGMKHGEQTNPSVTFSLKPFEKSIYDKLGKYDQEMIALSPEYQKLVESLEATPF